MRLRHITSWPPRTGGAPFPSTPQRAPALFRAMLTFFFDKDGDGAGIPSRAEVKPEDTWDLTPLYASPADWTADFALLQVEYPAIAVFRGKVGESAATLHDLLECDQRISR